MGWSCDGSTSSGPVRKELTSCPSCGLKGAGVKVSVGVFDVVDPPLEASFDGFRPVNLSQNDIFGIDVRERRL